MKRGKDDGKIVEPMFPRLHVNDTEKGGPRAPPRNKMALYEQLSIPSQRFNPGLLPLNQSNASSLVPPSSSSQGSSHERNMFFPSRVSHLTSSNLAEKIHTRQLGGESVNALVGCLEPRKKIRDEDDFLVPVFVNRETGQQHSKNRDGFDGEKLTPLGANHPHYQIKLQNVCVNDPHRSSSSGVSLRKEVKDQSEESSKMCSSGEHLVKFAADLSTREKIDGCTKEDNVSPDQDCGELPASRLSSSCENDSCSPKKLRAGRRLADDGHIDDTAVTIGEGILSGKRSRSHLDGNHSVPEEANNDGECHGDKTCGSLHLANGDKTDDVSETSMLDSISGLDITPDDMVGILGQKHFWKARRLIVNQQRVFAVQVFELHRLIKVQRLITGSPHLLLEDMAYLDKPSFKGPPVKKLPLEIIVKPLPLTKHKDDSEKQSHKMECSAENAIGRTSLSSVKNGSQPSNCGPFVGNTPPTPVNCNNTMNPWCFNQMVGQQWLVPVMSPLEGLIYKPYPGPGFMGSACGGCGPLGQTPMTGNFTTSAYWLPAPAHQGPGVLPGAPPFGHYYYPPYGIPVMNPALSGSAVEQINQFAGSGSHAQSGLLSGGEANFNMQHQSSCILPGEKNGAIPHVMKFQASKPTELQGSTASSPGERLQREGTDGAAGGKNAPPFSPTVPAIPERPSQPHEADQRTKVIKVVPHNPQSATETAARIFQSIQKGRKQHD